MRIKRYIKLIKLYEGSIITEEGEIEEIINEETIIKTIERERQKQGLSKIGILRDIIYYPNPQNNDFIGFYETYSTFNCSNISYVIAHHNNKHRKVCYLYFVSEGEYQKISKQLIEVSSITNCFGSQIRGPSNKEHWWIGMHFISYLFSLTQGELFLNERFKGGDGDMAVLKWMKRNSISLPLIAVKTSDGLFSVEDTGGYFISYNAAQEWFLQQVEKRKRDAPAKRIAICWEVNNPYDRGSFLEKRVTYPIDVSWKNLIIPKGKISHIANPSLDPQIVALLTEYSRHFSDISPEKYNKIIEDANQVKIELDFEEYWIDATADWYEDRNAEHYEPYRSEEEEEEREYYEDFEKEEDSFEEYEFSRHSKFLKKEYTITSKIKNI